jgi:dolichyl-phosphate-mannose--protein O-mannosyl transferase
MVFGMLYQEKSGNPAFTVVFIFVFSGNGDGHFSSLFQSALVGNPLHNASCPQVPISPSWAKSVETNYYPRIMDNIF